MTFTGHVSVMPTWIQPDPLEEIKALMVLLYFYSINLNSIEMIGFRVHFCHRFSDEFAGSTINDKSFAVCWVHQVCGEKFRDFFHHRLHTFMVF